MWQWTGVSHQPSTHQCDSGLVCLTSPVLINVTVDTEDCLNEAISLIHRYIRITEAHHKHLSRLTRSQFYICLINWMRVNSSCSRCHSLYGEEMYSTWVEVQFRLMVNQRPDVWNKELIWSVLLYITELQLRKFLTQNMTALSGRVCINLESFKPLNGWVMRMYIVMSMYIPWVIEWMNEWKNE